MMKLPQPRVIFVDAVGTLFGVKGSVGEIYATLARQHGIDTDPALINQAFFKAFRAAPEMAFPGSDLAMVPEQEYRWWRVIAQQTFSSAGVLDRFVDFDGFFADLYSYFATAEPWVIYPDVPAALERWRRRGIALGIISNFDTRLYQVLEELNLANFFSSVTLSSEAGAAKPDPLIFATALQKHRCDASQAWHLGDSKAEDIDGATAAGLRGVWVRRKDNG
ncbi:MAG TPA: HAD family hydrolase [Nodosilinea sp.]|nr:HAD family hydrolase [Nodosilinea sp.]